LTIYDLRFLRAVQIINRKS